jgi:putative tricarboxylic transport membrane protein
VLPFFDRPVSAVLAAMTFGALLWPVGVWVYRRVHGSGLPAAKATG